MQVHQIESWRALLSFRISDTLYHITIFQVVSIIYTDHYIIHQVSLLQPYSAPSPAFKAYTSSYLIQLFE